MRLSLLQRAAKEFGWECIETPELMPRISAIKQDARDSFHQSLLAKKIHGTYHKDNDSQGLFDWISQGSLSLANTAYVLNA